MRGHEKIAGDGIRCTGRNRRSRTAERLAWPAPCSPPTTCATDRRRDCRRFPRRITPGRNPYIIWR